jgi:hypothetical protein
MLPVAVVTTQLWVRVVPTLVWSVVCVRIAQQPEWRACPDDLAGYVVGELAVLRGCWSWFILSFLMLRGRDRESTAAAGLALPAGGAALRASGSRAAALRASGAGLP